MITASILPDAISVYNTTSMRINEVLDSGIVGRILGGKAFVTWHRDVDYYARGTWRGTWDKEGGGL
jgi:UDP-N-acetyl-2-amino-2-deoxyglucuronate dehydrogenase